jgi:hypothetical protein
MEAAAGVLGLYAAILSLHVLLPTYTTTGYVRDVVSGKPLRYKLNAPASYVCAVSAWAACWLADVRAGRPHGLSTALARNFWASAAASCLIGLALSAYMIWLRPIPAAVRAANAARRCPTVDQPMPTASARDERTPAIYWGVEFNPRVGGVDVKMFLYLLGAVVLQYVCRAVRGLAGGQIWQRMGMVSSPLADPPSAP